ncbi:hypothetical protein VCR8J2_240147 [Vibrio coralliirubri]|nr:hypothetical protein VCR8J2_240147 [Vibrio coralliirubri]
MAFKKNLVFEAVLYLKLTQRELLSNKDLFCF